MESYPTYTIRAALIISIISSLLSIGGGILIIISYVKIPNIRNTVRRLLLCLTIADLITAAGNLVGGIRYVIYEEMFDHNITLFPNDAVCTGQAFVTTFSNVSSFMWTIMIAAHLVLAVVFDRNLHRSHKRLVRVINHGIGWIVPGINSIIPLATNKFGEDGTYVTGAWCWISSDLPQPERIKCMYTTAKMWEISAYILTAALYILLKGFTWRKRRRHPNYEWSQTHQRLRKEDENFCFTWGILYLLRIWGTVRFFVAIYSPELFNPYKTGILRDLIFYLQCFGASAQAFCNFILFCVCDKTVRESVTRMNRNQYRELEGSINNNET